MTGTLSDTPCGYCLVRPPAWRSAISALVYDYPVDHLVKRFKFRRDLACGKILADRLKTAVASRNFPLPDLVLPVPLHFSRQWIRGFNQAEYIALRVASSLNIRFENRLLTRTRRTAAQSGLHRREREKNLSGAFRCKPLDQRSVALVDDVLTTGTTLEACARVVRRAGAKTVSAWVCARVPAPSRNRS